MTTRLKIFLAISLLLILLIGTGIIWLTRDQSPPSDATSADVPAAPQVPLTAAPSITAPSTSPWLVDYTQVFNQMHETGDLTRLLQTRVRSLLDDDTQKKAAVAKLLSERDQLPKGSAEYEAKAAEYAQASAAYKAWMNAQQSTLKADQVQIMWRVYKKVEAATTQVAASHGIPASPAPNSPKLPSGAELSKLSPDSFRTLIIQRRPLRPTTAPDLTDEVIELLNKSYTGPAN